MSKEPSPRVPLYEIWVRVVFLGAVVSVATIFLIGILSGLSKFEEFTTGSTLIDITISLFAIPFIIKLIYRPLYSWADSILIDITSPERLVKNQKISFILILMFASLLFSLMYYTIRLIIAPQHLVDAIGNPRVEDVRVVIIALYDFVLIGLGMMYLGSIGAAIELSTPKARQLWKSAGKVKGKLRSD